MGRYILKVHDHYCEWSTVVDAPVTDLMPLDKFQAYYRFIHGEEGMERLPERLARADAVGVSALDGTTAHHLFSYNRAGPNETHLDKRGLWEVYGPKPQPPPPGTE